MQYALMCKKCVCSLFDCHDTRLICNKKPLKVNIVFRFVQSIYKDLHILIAKYEFLEFEMLYSYHLIRCAYNS